MRHAHHRPAALALMLLAATLAGCAHRPFESAPPPPVAAPIDRPAEIDAIVALLDKGDTAAASPRIDALLARDPADPQARVLRDSIDRDPVALLGPKSFAYTAKAGDTMLGLSERFLGNRLKSYELARYNGIAVPASLAAGTVLHIPGLAPRPEPGARAAPRPRPSRAKAESAGAAATPAAPAVHSDPASARQARAAGLAALGQGRIADAVAALRRAAALDSGNPLIQRDLARAERIAGTVRARR